MPYTLSAVVRIGLQYPYHESLYVLYKLINVWNFRLISSKFHSQNAVIEIPRDKFKKIFGADLKKGKWHVPSGTESFIGSVEVIEIIKKDIK